MEAGSNTEGKKGGTENNFEGMEGRGESDIVKKNNGWMRRRGGRERS